MSGHMSPNGILGGLVRVRRARTLRHSSYQADGRNSDRWTIEPGETRVMAEMDGPGCITHIWMTQQAPGDDGYRKVLLKMYWDGERSPSVLVPLGDFFCQGHSIVNSFQSLPLTSSTRRNNQWGAGAALNCYFQMPFGEHARIEITNEADQPYGQYFYVDYELYDEPLDEDVARFHAQFRRENPCPGWGHEIRVNSPQANIANKERLAWKNNYVILEAKGAGHYVGCNISVANFQGTWWGEGDDMIWVDGYKWPPDLHGTGSEDYFNQAWGMQDNAYLWNGSSIHEQNTGGYQTSYVFHLTNPVRFRREIRATIEHGHGNHLANEYSSVAYWYQIEPHAKFGILPLSKRLPVRRAIGGDWIPPRRSEQTAGRTIGLNAEMRRMKAQWARKHGK